jgi:methyl-accepting chemotaxis protein
MKIRWKLLAGFLGSAAITACLGGYAMWAQSHLGDVAMEIYDGPLMAISYARSAEADFSNLGTSVAKLRAAQNDADRKASFEAAKSNLDDMRVDLGVAQERSILREGPQIIAALKAELDHWDVSAAGKNGGDPVAIAAATEKVHGLLGQLIEKTTAAGFEYRQRAEARVATERLQMALIVGFGVAISVIIALVLGHRISLPLRRAVATADAIAGGQLDSVIAAGTADETGQLLRALSAMQDSIRNRIEQQAEATHERDAQRELAERARTEQQSLQLEQERRLAAEQEARRAEEERRREEESRRREEAEARHRAIRELAEGFEGTVKSVVQAVSSAAEKMQSTASSMDVTAEQTRQQSTGVAGAIEHATENVQTVAAATEELSASVAEIGRQVADSTRIAEDAVVQAARTNATVKGLSEAAQKIGKVVEMINGIAGQTNLLALNATIEAARAGEAGKGFAVVASEVKSLASQTAKATEEIGAQIAGMQQVTADTVQDIGRIGATIQDISKIAAAIAASIEQQGAATQEIARNVQQTATATKEISGNIGAVTHAAGETRSAAQEVLGASTDLARQSDQLRSEVAAFVQRILVA